MAVLAYQAATSYQRLAPAASTQQQYDFHLRQFAEFCTVTGINFARLSEQAVCAYVAYLAGRHLRHSTVQQYLKGLRDYFVRAGYTEFASRALWPELYRTLKGVKRAHHSGSAQKLPVSPDMLLEYAGGWT